MIMSEGPRYLDAAGCVKRDTPLRLLMVGAGWEGTMHCSGVLARSPTPSSTAKLKLARNAFTDGGSSTL